MFHTGCKIETTYDGACYQLYNNFFTKALYDLKKDQSKAVFDVLAQSKDEFFWVHKTTPSGKYSDDILFEFTDDSSKCKVVGQSRSRDLSFVDYNTNYCNVFNIL